VRNRTSSCFKVTLLILLSEQAFILTGSELGFNIINMYFKQSFQKREELTAFLVVAFCCHRASQSEPWIDMYTPGKCTASLGCPLSRDLGELAEELTGVPVATLTVRAAFDFSRGV